VDPSFETIYPDENSSIRGMYFECVSFEDDHRWHYHPEYELTFIMESQGTRFVGDSVLSYEPGDLVLVGPNLPHCWHNDQLPSAGSNQARLAVLQFSQHSFGEHFLSLPETREISSLLEQANSGIQFHDVPFDVAEKSLLEICACSGMARMIRFLDFFHRLSREHEFKQLASQDYHRINDVNEQNRSRIEKIHVYVRKNLELEFSQKDVADMVGLTPSAFSRFFRTATGMTFVNFVNRIRITEACRMLMDENTEITQIAFACGYNNTSNFNRQFLSHKGMSPSEFRRQRLKLEQH